MVLKDVLTLPLNLFNRRGSRSGSSAATSGAAVPASGKDDEAAVILVGDSSVTEKHPEGENERGTWCVLSAVHSDNLETTLPNFKFLCFKLECMKNMKNSFLKWPR
jgi:hypothetical protein